MCAVNDLSDLINFMFAAGETRGGQDETEAALGASMRGEDERAATP
jgi:hypothetical protein